MSKKLFLKEYEGIVTLSAGHSLITGHGPRLAAQMLQKAEEEAAQRKSDLSSLGLFEVATPNFNTYYPDATLEDIQPKEEEYIRPVYRALSEVVVRKQFDPIDFSKDNVLKSSMGMLLGQTVYTNHESFIGNEVGVVSKVFWDEGYKTDGMKIPAGINAEFLIDGKANPKLARNILMDPPAVHSNSVTLQFLWAQSHPKMSVEDFRSKVGSYDEKGQLIRRIATEITMYLETSLVSHGADPFAQRVNKDGKIVNPSFATQRDSFSENKPGASQYHFFSWKDSLSENITIPTQLNDNTIKDDKTRNPENKPKMNKANLIYLASLIGFEIPEDLKGATEEEFSEKFDQAAFDEALEASHEKLTLVNEDEEQPNIEELTSRAEAAEAEVERLTALVNAAKDNTELAEVIADLRADVTRLYSASTGKTPSEALQATFSKANYETLKAFRETYQEQLEEKFPGSCAECGSTNIARNSSVVGNEEEVSKSTKTADVTKMSASELLRAIRRGDVKVQPTEY